MYTNRTIIPPKNNIIKMKEIHFEEMDDSRSLIRRVIKISAILANRGVFINIKKNHIANDFEDDYCIEKLIEFC